MRKITSIILLNVFLLNLCAQPYFFSKQWDKRYGGTLRDPLNCLVETDNGGFILGGFSPSGISGDKTQANWDTTLNTIDYWIVKTDENGNKEWDKRFGGLGQDNLSDVKPTFDGGYILGGESGSGISGDKTETSRGNNDYWVVKTDAYGNKEWDKSYGGSGDDELRAIIQTKDSGYIIGGYSNSPSGGDISDTARGGYDIWLVKVDSSGIVKWNKRYGGSHNDFGAYFIDPTIDGGYLLMGSSDSDISGDKSENSYGTTDYWVIKIDSLGNKIWDKAFGGISTEFLFAGLKIGNDGFLLGGCSFSGINGNKTEANKGGEDYWLVKIDVFGNKIWERDFGGLGQDELYTLVKTKDSGILLSGSSKSNSAGDKSESNLGLAQTWIVKTDSLGNKQWDKTIFTTGNDLWSGYCLQTSDGCYAIANYTATGIGGYKTQDTRGLEDYWIMKFCMDTIAGINELTNQPQITVYPNPFTTDLSIALKQENVREAIFTITNALGQTVYSRDENNLATGYTKMLDLSYLPNGVYFVVVTTKHGRMVKEIVKK